jgi:L,D-transpeptidase YcbB
MRVVTTPILAVFSILVAAAAPVEARGQAVVTPSTQAVLMTEMRTKAGRKFGGFYARRSGAPQWIANGTIGSAADTFIAFLDSASLDGIKTRDGEARKLRRTIEASRRSGDTKSLVATELALTKAFIRYVGDVRAGPAPRIIIADEVMKPRKPDVAATLTAATLDGSFSGYVTTMGWNSPHYTTQRRLLARAIANGEPDEMVKRIRGNRDRARLLPSAYTHHIVVDSASGRLIYYQAGKEAGRMRVVVGKAQTPTPMMAGIIRYAIFNPYWNVPVDMAQTSVAPKILAGRTLASMRMEALSDWTDRARRLDPKTIDWRAVANGATELRVRQLPGGDNAMGRVKFMFPNEQGIYLHDTPEKTLMAKENRHFSNGCIRLEDAARLSKWLFNGAPMPARSKVEQVTPLPHAVPIYLTYLTTDGSGERVTMRDDVYGLDAIAD